VASLYALPGVRVKFRPAAAWSPFLAAGAGYALYEQSTRRIDGQPNPAPRFIHRGALDFGGGLDFKVWRFAGGRIEVRDFYSGNPGFNAPVNGGQHSLVNFGSAERCKSAAVSACWPGRRARLQGVAVRWAAHRSARLLQWEPGLQRAGQRRPAQPRGERWDRAEIRERGTMKVRCGIGVLALAASAISTVGTRVSTRRSMAASTASWPAVGSC
jgi:hypothetical protein